MKETGMDRRIEKKRWTPKKIIWVSLAVLLVVGILYVLVFGDKSSRLNVRQERLTISTVTRGPFQEFIPETGTVIPIKTIYLDAMEGGRDDEIFLEAGSFVKQGDEILQLGNTSLLMDIMYREAELFQQSNNLRNTRLAMEQNRLQLQAQLLDLNYQIKQQKRIYDQQTELYAKNLVSEQEWEEARDRYEYLVRNRELTLLGHKQDSIFRKTKINQIEASLRRMEDNLDIVKRNLENLTIRAPVSGQLTSLNAEIGESKSRGQRLGQIDVLDGFKIRVRVDEYYLPRIDLGQKGEFSFAGQAIR